MLRISSINAVDMYSLVGDNDAVKIGSESIERGVSASLDLSLCGLLDFLCGLRDLDLGSIYVSETFFHASVKISKHHMRPDSEVVRDA